MLDDILGEPANDEFAAELDKATKPSSKEKYLNIQCIIVLSGIFASTSLLLVNRKNTIKTLYTKLIQFSVIILPQIYPDKVMKYVSIQL